MEWRDIAGYEGRYKVSNTGLVKSCEHYRTYSATVSRIVPEKILKQWKRSKYSLVDLWKDGVRDVRSVHVLVYESFNGPLQDNEIIHHKDGDKFNNNVDNLEKITMLEHNRLHHCGGTPWNKGKTMPAEIYTKMWNKRKPEIDVKYEEVFKYADEGLSAKEISERTGYCRRHVYTILNRRK